MLDTMVRVDRAFLAAHSLRPGDATALATASAFAELKAAAALASSERVVTCPGGCACNMAKVLARLDCATAFCGGLGVDAAAATFCEGLRHHGIENLTAAAALETGEVLCLVTPDGERTFAYRSGASAALGAPALLEATHRYAGGLGLVVFDAYLLLWLGDSLEAGAKEARRCGARIALNCGSRGLVSAHRDRLWALLRAGLCDALFMNADEADALCSCDGVAPASPEAACAAVAEVCDLVVVTLGVEGLWAADGRGAKPQRFSVLPCSRVVDSTGAGDFFAGAFVAAWLRGLATADCAARGAAAAAAVLGIFGTEPPEEIWALMRGVAP